MRGGLTVERPCCGHCHKFKGAVLEFGHTCRFVKQTFGALKLHRREMLNARASQLCADNSPQFCALCTFLYLQQVVDQRTYWRLSIFPELFFGELIHATPSATGRSVVRTVILLVVLKEECVEGTSIALHCTPPARLPSRDFPFSPWP